MSERDDLILMMQEAERRGDMETAKNALKKIEMLERPDPFINSATQPFEGTERRPTGIGSAALTAGTGAAAQIISGIGGLTDVLVNQDPETASQNMGRFQRDFTAKPTKEGAQVLGTLGEQIDRIGKILSIPIDALDAIATGITTGSTGQMVDRYDANRAGASRGDRALVLGPAAATAAEIGPEVAFEGITAAAGLTGVKGLTKASQKIKAILDKPEIQVFDDAGKFTDDAIVRLEQLQASSEAAPIVSQAISEAQKAGAILTPEQARRLNLFKERGVTPLAGDITRKTEDTLDQQQALKEPGKFNEQIQNIVANQERQIKALAQQGITETGGIANDAVEASASIRRAITNVASELDAKVSKAYNSAKSIAEGNVVDVSDYIEFVKSNRGKDKITGGVVSSAASDLKNKGLLKKDADTTISVEMAEEIRQALNQDFESATPRGKAMLRQMKEAIDADVEAAVGSDIFAEARAANIRYKNALKRAKRDKFDKTKGSLIEDILDNKIPEEKIFDKIISPTTRVDDIEKLRDFLLSYGIKQSWDDLRAQVLRNALDKATSTKGFREGGEAIFNVRLFENELKRIKGRKFDILFNADEKQLIQDISEIGNARIPISGTFQGEGPSSVAVRRAAGEIRDTLLERIPGVGPLAQGMLDAMRSRARAKRLTQFTEKTEEAIRRGQ